MSSRIRARLITGLVFAVCLLAGPARALARPVGPVEGSVTLHAQTTDSDLDQRVSSELSKPGVSSVIVLYDDMGGKLQEPTQVETAPELVVSPRGRYPIITTHQLKNARYVAKVTGTTEIASAIGEPGITLSISETRGISSSYSCSVNVSASAVSACVGFSVTQSHNVQVSGSARVPTTHGGRTVRKMTLHAYPVYKKYRFDVYERKTRGGALIQRQKRVGGGTALYPCGVEFKKTYQYK